MTLDLQSTSPQIQRRSQDIASLRATSILTPHSRPVTILPLLPTEFLLAARGEISSRQASGVGRIAIRPDKHKTTEAYHNEQLKERPGLGRLTIPLLVTTVISLLASTAVSQDRYSKVRVPISSREEIIAIELFFETASRQEIQHRLHNEIFPPSIASRSQRIRTVISADRFYR